MTDTLNWPAREAPLRGGYDVFVAGAGIAGDEETAIYNQRIDTIREDERVRYAMVALKSRVEAFESELFIDDTGDANLPVWFQVMTTPWPQT